MTTHRALWIAIDLDGTAWSHTFFFGEIARGLQARGHKVGILTSHSERLRLADIDLWRKRGFPPPDFYICKTDAEAAIPAAEWKPAMMQKHSIDWLFDDLDTGAIRLLTTEPPER